MSMQTNELCVHLECNRIISPLFLTIYGPLLYNLYSSTEDIIAVDVVVWSVPLVRREQHLLEVVV